MHFFYFSTKGFNSSDIIAHWTLDGTDSDVKWVECLFLTFSPSTENIDVICNTWNKQLKEWNTKFHKRRIQGNVSTP